MQRFKDNDNPNSIDGIEFLDISKLNTIRYGKSIAYVMDVKSKVAVNGQPYLILYLKDCKGFGITGFKFNISEYVKKGVDLPALKGKFIVIEYYENCSYGNTISLIVDTLSLVKNQEAISTDNFIGGIENLTEICSEVLQSISEVLNTKINISKIKMMIRHPNYCEGRTGGVMYHHYLTLQLIKQFKYFLTEMEYRELIFSFMIFLVAHLELIASGNDKFNTTETTMLLQYAEKCSQGLHMHCNAVEIIYYFNKVEPEDFFIRTITTAFETVKKTQAELYVNRIIPVGQAGNAGYGIIKRNF